MAVRTGAEKCPGFTADTFSGRQALRDKDVPAIVLDNSANGVVSR